MTFRPSVVLLCFATILSSILHASHADAATGVVNSGQSLTTSNSVVTIEAIVPHLVQFNVVLGSSTLTTTLTAARMNTGSNTVGTDYQIRGNVFANGLSDIIDTTLSTTSVQLTDGNSHFITVHLSGSIGGTTVGTTAFQPVFGSGSAAITVNGDLDESTVDSTDAPGTYSGSVTMTSTIR